MKKHKQEQPSGGDTPPPGISVENLAEWWRGRGANLDKVKTLSAKERKCPNCKDLQPCTGIDHCTSCGYSLSNAKRTNTNIFESQ